MAEPRRIRRLTPEDMPRVASDEGPLPGWDVQEIDEEPEREHLAVPVDAHRLTEEWSKTRKLREATAKKEETYKRQVMDLLDTDGEEDNEGHKYFHFENDPVPGFDKKAIVGVKREKRVGATLDQDAAMKLIRDHGLESTCIETIEVINEDGLLAANFGGVIPDDELQALYTEKITYAFVPIKEKS